MALIENTDLQNKLIAEAKKSLENNDLYMAKSWFLTASSMFPNSFKIQFERYLLAKKEENIDECCKILTELLKLEDNIELNQEIDQIVDAVKSSDILPENNFKNKLFISLTNQQQYELLLKVANKTDNQSNYCQLILLIMKKFPDKINQHALSLIDIINENKLKDINKKDYFNKLLIFDVYPLVLSSESNLKLSNEQVEKLLENLFNIYFQQSSIGKVNNDETLNIECTITMNQIQSKLREIFNLVRIKMKWDEFILINDKLSINNLNEQYDQLMIYYKNLKNQINQNQINNCKLKQVFYTSFMLFLIYLDNYIKLTVSKLILIQQNQIQKSNQQLNHQNKKRKLINELNENDLNQKLINQTTICTNDELQTAFTGTNKIFAFLNQDHLLQQELFRMIDLVGLDRCKSYEIFIVDTYFYKGDNESLLNYFIDKKEYSVKTCVQLVNSSLITNNYSLTLEHTIKLVNMISNYSFKVDDNQCTNEISKIIAQNQRSQLTFVNYNKSDILSYAIDVIIYCLNELVLNTNKPTDLGIGHVIVLSQYKWPSNIIFFIKCFRLIKSNFQNSKFNYPSFTKFVLNTAMIEEFRSIVDMDNLKIELCIQKPSETKLYKTMTTRGVNKNAKEEIKNTLINQMKCSKINIDDDLFINFIINELKDFSNPIKKTSKRS